MNEIMMAEDVTDAHVDVAVDLCGGMYGGMQFSWDDVVSRLEDEFDEDWGGDSESAAIRALKSRVRQITREAQ